MSRRDPRRREPSRQTRSAESAGRSARRAPKRRTWFTLTVDFVFWVAVLSATVMLLSVVSGRTLFDRLDEEIRGRVQQQLAACFPDLRVTVGRARRLDTQGIELGEIAFYDRSDGSVRRKQPLGVIDRAVLHCRTEFTNLAHGDLQPSALEIDGLQLRVRQNAAGHWNFENLRPHRRDDGEPIPMLIRDVRMMVTTRNGATTRLADLEVDVLPHYLEDVEHPSWTIKARHGSGASQLSVEGRVDPREEQFTFSLTAPRQEIHPDWVALCAQLGAPVEQWQARGVLHNIHSTLWGGKAKPLRYRLSCELRGGRLEHPELPVPLDNLRANIAVDTQQVRITNIDAVASGARMHADEVFWDVAQKHLKTSLLVEGLRFDERLAGKLPSKMREAWAAHNAVGEVVKASWTFEHNGAQGIIQNAMQVECRDMSFQFPALPYRFHRATGAFVLNGDQLAINLRAPLSGQQVRIVGDIRKVGTDDSHGWIELGTEGAVSLDQEMIAALSPRVQKVVRSFQPRGTLNLWCRMHRDGPNRPLHRETILQLESVAVQYAPLPYPVNRMQGVMKMQDGNWTVDVRGRNDDAQITCRGNWHEDLDINDQLSLQIRGERVTLDNELRHALPASTQRLWGKMNPRGALDEVAIDLIHDKRQDRTHTHVTLAKKTTLSNAEAPTAAISLQLPGLPYRLENVTGLVTYRDGVTLLEGLRGVHNDTTWEAEGRTINRDDEWIVEMTRLVADNLTVDRDMLGCLPPTVAPNVSRLQLRGPIDIDGQLTVQGAKQPESVQRSSRRRGGPEWTRRANWDFMLDVENAAVRFGQLPLEKIRGQVRMRGASKDGRFAVNGELNIDSLESRQTTVHQIRGPLSMDNRSVRLGTWANSEQPRQLKARVLGGVLSGDVEFKLDGSQEFELTASLSEGQLSDIARRSLPVGGRVAGQAGGALLLKGSTRGVHTFVGEGYAEMKDADIYEAPVMVSLLQLFSSRDADKSLISNGTTSFRIVGDRVYLDQMELDGAIRLRGSGEMNFQRQLHLKLYSAMGGREDDPSLMLFREASRRILEIEVGGTLEHPLITRRAFPELNDTLQRLFPEANRRRSVAGGLPTLRGRLKR